MDQTQTHEKAFAVIMAASREMGVELVSVHERSINKMKFKMFLEELRAKNPFDDIMLHMDNISFHKSDDVKERMDMLGFHYTYSPKYSPQYNGVEEIINIGKKTVKKARLDMIVNGQRLPLKKVVHDAFVNIDELMVSKCVVRSLRLLNLDAE